MRPMQTHSTASSSFRFLAAGILAGVIFLNPSVRAASPPPGFESLFNGKDLSGWWGASTEDPRKYKALSPEEFQAKHAKSLEDVQQH